MSIKTITKIAMALALCMACVSVRAEEGGKETFTTITLKTVGNSATNAKMTRAWWLLVPLINAAQTWTGQQTFNQAIKAAAGVDFQSGKTLTYDSLNGEIDASTNVHVSGSVEATNFIGPATGLTGVIAEQAERIVNDEGDTQIHTQAAAGEKRLRFAMANVEGAEFTSTSLRMKLPMWMNGTQFLDINRNASLLTATATTGTFTNAVLGSSSGILKRTSGLVSNATDGTDYWSPASDGSGSGLDADLLDGHNTDYFATAASSHDAVTLGSDADVLLGLSTQQLTLDSQSANKIFAGPTTGSAADPTFRDMVDADIPAAITRDSEADARYLSFRTIDAGAGTDPVADLFNDTLALTGDSEIVVTGDSATDSIALSIGSSITRDSEAAAAYQPLDSDLTYLAGFTPSANVKSILNAADYSAVRTLLSLVVGTNVEAWDADLDAVAALGSTGFSARTASNTWAQRSFSDSSEIAWTNPAGVSGNPSAALVNGSIANARLANSSITIGGASTALGGTVTANTILDSIGSTRGSLLYRGASAWSARTPSAAGKFFRDAGSGADPDWSTLVLPNSATANRIVYATSTNTWGDSSSLTFDGTALSIPSTLTFPGFQLVDLAALGKPGSIAFRSTASNTLTQGYWMPNGTVASGTRNKIEGFGTDYYADPVNYNSWSLRVRNDATYGDGIYFGSNQAGSASVLPITFTYDGSGTIITRVLKMNTDGTTEFFLGSTFDSTVSITGAASAATLDTGQGANELYDMDQNVQTTDAVRHARMGIGAAADASFPLVVNHASTNYIQLKNNGTTKGYIGTISATNNLITGSAAGDLGIRTEAGSILLSTNGGAAAYIKIDNSGSIFMAGLTDSDPGVEGQLWDNGGTLSISHP